MLRPAIPFVCLLVVSATLARASSFVEEIRRAQYVVAGTIVNQTGFRTPSGAVRSRVVIKSLAFGKGSTKSDSLQPTVYGGLFDGSFYFMTGKASLVTGQRYILFLTSRASTSDDPEGLGITSALRVLPEQGSRPSLVVLLSGNPVLGLDSTGVRSSKASFRKDGPTELAARDSMDVGYAQAMASGSSRLGLTENEFLEQLRGVMKTIELRDSSH